MGTNRNHFSKGKAPHFAGATLLLCVVLPASARADTSGTITLQAAQDSNVFRRGQGTGLAVGACRSDQSVQAQGQLNHAFGDPLASAGIAPANWSGTFSGTLSDTRYRCNTALNNTAGNARLQLATPAFGAVFFTFNPAISRQQTSLEFVGSTGINSQFLGQMSASAGLHITPDLALVVSPGFTYSRNSSRILGAQNYDKYGYQAGISYTSGLGNSVSILAKINKTRGPHAIIAAVGTDQFDVRTNYRERGVNLGVNYAISPLTHIYADLGYLKWTDLRNIPAATASYPKSYGGFVGSLRATYQPDAQTSFELSASRQFASLDLLFVSGIVFDDFYVNLKKKLSSRISSSVKFDLVRQRFIQNPSANQNQSDHNKVFNLSAEVNYSLRENLQVNFTYSHQNRLSGGQLNPFSENSARVQFAYSF